VTGLKFFVDNAPQPDLLGKAIEGRPIIPLSSISHDPFREAGRSSGGSSHDRQDTQELYAESRARMFP